MSIIVRTPRGAAAAGAIAPHRRHRLGRLLIGSLIVAAVWAWSTPAASAHPLGNFTVNRYARVEVSAGRVRVYYVLDEAEIPALQEGGSVTSDPLGFARRRVDELLRHVRLTVDGRPLTLRPVGRSLDRPPGQGGLKTLRVAAVAEADLPAGGPDQRHRLQFADTNEPARIGWREIVAVARGDARIESSSAPARDVSDELRHYPGDLIQAPLDLRAATVTFTPGTQPAAALPVPRSAPPPARAGGAFADLITRENLNPLALAGMLGLAMLLGAGHALLPGHGKTVMAAYLVGTRGRPVDAVLLGVIVSLMHTISVLVLGLVLFRVSRTVAVDRIYPHLTIASGVLAMAFGVWLLALRTRELRRGAAPGRDHAHGHDHGSDHSHDHGLGRADHGHGHAHAADHDHHHEPAPVHALAGGARPSGPLSRADVADLPDDDGTHHPDPAAESGHTSRTGAGDIGTSAPPAGGNDHPHGSGSHHHGPGGHTHELPEGVAPLSRRGLIVLATSGGIVPSPSAVIVVVSAFSLGRAALGLTLIAAFSIGLAATLTAVGLTLVLGRAVLERRWPNRSLRYLPVAGAATLIVLGAVLVSEGLRSR